MKGATWLCLLAGLLAANAQSSLGQLERVSFLGTEYVRLPDWARARHFQTRWTVPKEELRLVSPGSTLVFWADSRKISINGILVWLSVPVTMRHGTAYIAPTDLLSTVHPILFPARSGSGRPIRTICLDPGHGGKDPGNREGNQFEKKYTLLLAQELASQLKSAGFNVCFTRNSDSFVELPARPEIARRRGADLFLSLHFNSADHAGASTVKGVEVYCLTTARGRSTNARGDSASTAACPGNRFDTKNVLLAYQLQRALLRKLGTEDRGVRRARFAVLRGAEMPAALIEAGFMSHPTEARKIYDAAYRRQMAQAIVEGIRAYKNSVER
jgi:N-acetylmuramoyl-L-alanine amidase